MAIANDRWRGSSNSFALMLRIWTTIMRLQNVICPSDIARNIAFRIVNSIERSSRWARSYFFEKKFKIFCPSRVHYDSSSAVISKRFIFGIEATISSIEPCLVFRRPMALSMLKTSLAGICIAIATATLNFFKIACAHDNLASAIAQTIPIGNVFAAWSAGEDDQSMNTMLCQINEFSHTRSIL